MSNANKLVDRRKFIENASIIGLIGGIGSGYVFSSCNSKKSRSEFPVFPDIAPDGPPLKAGLIGCGNRGTGAAINFLNAGPNLQITALGDVFHDRLNSCKESLKKRHNVDIPDEKCFLGFDAYKKVIESDVDIILEASVTHFRPRHFEAAIKARKHVFIEKPAGVDPVGIKSVITSGKMAESAGLSVVAGTQRRHQRDYVETYTMVKNGAIGDLVSANCYWNTAGPPYVRKQDGWSDMEAMIRNRGNWTWLTGDTIVNLLVHQLDVINWFFEKHPSKATGVGGRHRRPSGDMYDFFSVDYVFDNERHFHGMCRQIEGCTPRVGEMIFGTKGYTNCQNKIFNYDGSIIWEYEYPLDNNGQPTQRVAVSPYDQEMIDFVTAIRTNNPVNEANNLAISSLVGIMGRESAYTGLEVSWEEMINSNLKLGPAEYYLGPVDIEPTSPIPGEA
ncbi:MAG: Gfo/Idh/MocA family oxidoreductase [Prolixibacteraceae bacterium]|nr:Gfo/Idh/MocA family oxidoreductase [Prolixibacteraceae bacterium]